MDSGSFVLEETNMADKKARRSLGTLSLILDEALGDQVKDLYNGFLSDFDSIL